MAKFAKKIHENKEIFLIKKFIGQFKRKVKKKVKGRFSFVLTGGDSPARLYQRLSKEKGINWKKVDFFVGDERFVSENSNYSNINLCKRKLLNNINISKKQIYKIDIKKKSLKKTSINYEKKLKKYFLNKKVKFDLILLGIGLDGHIASLFKDNIKIKSNKNVETVKRKDYQRITLSIKCINNSKAIFLWAPGKNRLNIIKKILIDRKFKYPASYLKQKNNYLFYSN